MLKIGVLVSGGGTNLQAIIDRIEAGDIRAEIELVISSNPRAYALERAKKHGIEPICIRKRDFDSPGQYTEALLNAFQKKNVGLVLMAGFNFILDPLFIRAYESKMMNVHPALIPSFCGKGYYGLRVHQAVLAKGVKLTGATVHFVTEEADDGPIILQKAIEVMEDDTPETLQKRVMEQCEQIIYPEAVRLFSENRLVVEGNRVRRKDA